MNIWGIGLTDMKKIAAKLGVELYYPSCERDAWRIKLVPKSKRFRRLTQGYLESHPERLTHMSKSGYMHAVCWHGHYYFMKEIFALKPNARIKSGMIDYGGAADFRQRANATGDENIGSQMHPLMYRKACDCEMPEYKIIEQAKNGELETELLPGGASRRKKPARPARIRR